MTAAFDAYEDSYKRTVVRSILFAPAYAEAQRAKVRVLTDIVRERHGALGHIDMLDVGCGVGLLHPLLRPLVATLAGVDVSGSCIARAEQAHPWARYDRSAGDRLPYEGGSFDFVATSCVMHHVLPSKWSSFVAEMKRVARPGGTVCVIEHNPLNPMTRLAVLRCPFDADARLLPAAKTRALLSGAGLVHIATRFFLIAPFSARWVGTVERKLANAPVGAQYAVIGSVP